MRSRVVGCVERQVAIHRIPQVIASHEPDARPAGAESGLVAGGASAARTGPQRSRRSNPAALHLRIPAREGADVGRWSAQAFARVANFNVSPQLLPAPNVTLSPVASRNRNRRAWTCTRSGLVGRGVRAMAQRRGEGAAVSCPRYRDRSRIAVHRTRLAMG